MLLFNISKVPKVCFWIRYVCVARRKFENQGPITEVKKIFALIGYWKNIIAYWEESKQSEALADIYDLFHTANIAGGSGGGQHSHIKILQFIPLFKFGNSISSS